VKEVFTTDAEFTEIGVFLDQELFTLPSQRLSGENSSELWLIDLKLIRG